MRPSHSVMNVNNGNVALNNEVRTATHGRGKGLDGNVGVQDHPEREYRRRSSGLGWRCESSSLPEHEEPKENKTGSSTLYRSPALSTRELVVTLIRIIE